MDVERSVPGNIHFGYVAAEAGYSDDITIAGGSLAEVTDPAHDPVKAADKGVEYVGPYDPSGKFDIRLNPLGFDVEFHNLGDDPVDARAVRFGLMLYRRYGRSLTQAAFRRELSAALPTFASRTPLLGQVSADIARDWPYSVGYFAPR